MQYLIKRGDWFYFSMRVQANDGKLFRMALKTRKRTKAYDIVQMVIDKIEGTKVSIKVLKLIVQEEIDRVIDKATALVTPDSEQGKQEFHRYYNGHFIPNSSHNHNLYSSGGVNGVDLTEFEKPVQRFDAWVKGEIKEVNTGYKLEQELREDTHKQFDKDYVQQNVLIELLNEYVNDIKSNQLKLLP